MPDPQPPAPGPAKGLLSNRPPLPPWWHEPYFWYAVFVVGVTVGGLFLGWSMPDVDFSSGGGGGSSGGGGGRSSSGYSFGGK